MADDKGYPLPDGPISGYPLICVTLKIPDALQYRQDFIGHIWELGKWWNWEHSGVPGDTRATQAAAYWRELIYDHMVIGECPVDCCDEILEAIAALQLQTTTQGKLNLTRDVQQQQIESQHLRDLYQERYDGSPTSINPNAPTTDFGSSGDRLDALCAALMAFVYQFARAQVQSVVASDVAAFAALATIAILLIPGLNLFYIAGASIALLAGGGLIGVTTATAAAALQDTAALNNVVCFMRNTLKAQSVTEANWSACLNSYPFATGSHEAIICDFIKPTLTANYLPMLDMLGQAYGGLINGEPVPECPCFVNPINLTATGYGGQTFGSFPSVVESGEAFDAVSTHVEGSYPDDQVIAMIFSQACVVTVHSVTDWDYCDLSPSDALYGYCPTDRDPNNLANWIFTRRSSGATSIPTPWNISANAVWFEGCVPGPFTVNLTLTAL